MTETRAISLTVNGQPRTTTVEARTTLVDLLREQFRLTGTHVGCEHGVCGACTVLVDGEAVRGCLLLAVQADGRYVETVESLAPDPARLNARLRHRNDVGATPRSEFTPLVVGILPYARPRRCLFRRR